MCKISKAVFEWPCLSCGIPKKFIITFGCTKENFLVCRDCSQNAKNMEARLSQTEYAKFNGIYYLFKP